MIELKYFKLIVSISEEGSLTKAADKLCLTQSALSHQLRDLETSVGFRVFNRVNRKLVPTERGYKLIKNGKRIIADISRTLESAALAEKNSHSTLKLLVECYSSFFWLPQVLKQFNFRYPDREVIVESNNEHNWADDLANYVYDVALVVNKKGNPNLVFRELIQDRLVVVLSKKHRLARQVSIGFESLRDQTLITHCKKSEVKEIFEHVVPPKSFKPHKIIQVNATWSIIDLVDEGIGVAVMSEWAIQKYCADREVLLIPFEKDQCMRPWYLATRKTDDTNNSTLYFIELLRTSTRASH